MMRKRSTNSTASIPQPEVRLNLHVLFLARFKQYEESLRYLSLVIKYFQNHRLIDHHNSPELSDEITQLTIELVTPAGRRILAREAPEL